MASEVDAIEGLPPLRPLREVIEVAIRAADWLDDKQDGVVIELARYYASLVDASVRSGSPVEFQKAMAVSGPNLHKALTSMGLTPTARGSVKADETVQTDAFDELRKRRARAQAKASKEA